MSAKPRVLKPTEFRPPPDEEPPAGSRAIADAAGMRDRVYGKVLDTVAALPPVSDGKHSLHISDVEYVDPPDFTPEEQKHAVLAGTSLGRRLRGTWELRDEAAGTTLDRRSQIVARVPYVSDRGLLIHRGTHYAVSNQLRLRPGTFVRTRGNGEHEVHVNAPPGEGVIHHYELDPAKGKLKLRVGQASVPLGPLVRLLGASDDEMRAAWGDAVHAANRDPDPAALKTLRRLFTRKLDATDEDLVKAYTGTPLDPDVSQRTLGAPHDRLSKEVVLKATSKLLKLAKGEVEEDDRDDPGLQRFLGIEDLLAERVARDHAGIRKGALARAVREGALAKLPSGLLTPQLEHAVLSTGLGQPVEEVNPMEVLDKLTRVTRMGEGGLPGLDAIPDSAREVRPSQLGFVDGVRTAESLRAGVDGYTTSAARKGDDGQLYAQFRDARTGQRVWRSPAQLHGVTLAQPGHEKWPFARLPVIRGGKLDYAEPHEIDLTPGHMEHFFSPLGNLVPGKSAMKAQRLAMASRMMTQALPLVGGEAPYVQNAVPGTDGAESYEEQHGSSAGAVKATQGGKVLGFENGKLQVAYDDGTTQDLDLYRQYPQNRRTLLHQEPTLQPGDHFKPGQPLVRSNYTDAQGTLALGHNLRTAFLPFRGLNHEDASVVSESAAKRLSSEHAYQHALELNERTKAGKGDYVGLFPGKFANDVLDTIDDSGLIKPGTKVSSGHPLILARRENEKTGSRIHRKGSKAYADASVLWDHDDPGEVTDVVQGKDGPVVVVKAISPLREGDKLAGRAGNKGVVAKIVPDAEMPHDSKGRPFEILLGPDGTVSRANPIQNIELALGKVVEKTGKPYKLEDFSHIDDLAGFARKELAKHGLDLNEDVQDSETGRKIPRVGAGNLWFMKLHHSAEGKEQARGTGSYDQDDAPSKGGFAGCLTLDAPLDTDEGQRPARLALARHATQRSVLLEAYCPEVGRHRSRVTDTFVYSVRSEDLVCVRFDNGQELTLTADHKFYRPDGTACPADQLAAGDLLRGLDDA